MLGTGLNSALKENKDLYQKMSYMNMQNSSFNKTYSAVSQNIPTIYYNDEKKAKRKKIYKYSALLTSAFVGAALIFKARNNKHLVEFVKNISQNTKELSLGKKITNIMSNTINIKDDIWNKFSSKAKEHHIGIFESVGNWITGIYKKGIKGNLGVKYDKIIEELKASGQLDELQKLGYDVDDFEKWFNKMNKNMTSVLRKKGERVTDKLFNKDILKKVSESNIADDKLKSLYQNQYIDISKINDEKLKKSAEELNKLKATLLPKMRDINCGSAPTDFLTIITSVLGLGIATAAAEDKKEKKSIVLNLGIPLIASLASATYGTIKCFSGATSLLFGLALGQIAKIGAKTIDKFTSKEENKA